ncbi:efflux RND transporter periplasmic adaptor subunit [Corallincola holothuriorum]|uniref:Efflux RND transporter periplasmic adaptor subunit n=1 Tax=Corallincola holothuriorum TaxID=2282215 RepID=A0A368NLQ5_9GAMM|nr:efflux RND transporter periplasmic adaptor subunit [Corallincola holothuriorum]RCU51040.1 efflux RND transporter periplasmic adaptor subunit [Corallincola holothuriorum]
MKNSLALIVAVTVGTAIGAGGYHYLSSPLLTSDGDNGSVEKQPIYWVAPMDPNYRRDKPGKSPMGMDLVPVYEEGSGADDSPGTIKISPEVENNLGVRTAKVEQQPLHQQIDTVGYIGFDKDNLAHVHPRVEGWLERLYIKVEGERIEKGQPIYSIYSPQLVNAQEELLLALDRNKRTLINSAKERLRALDVSENQIDKLVKTRKVSRTVTAYAPQSGVIAELNVSEGHFVKPGKTILSIGSLEEVWVTAEVFERQATLVSVGDTVSMSLDYLPSKEWTGVVDYIYPTLDPTNRTAKVRLRFANPSEELKPNMFARVAIHTQNDQVTLIVPREAVIRTGQQDRVVLALGEGKFKSVEVKLGRLSDLDVEIVKGVEANDSIVTSAQFLLDSESNISSDFMRMTIYEQSASENVWAEGLVTAMNPSVRTVTIDHKPVEAWEWPAMVMDFHVADSIELEQLQPGTSLHFEISKIESGYRIVGIHVMGNASEQMDHSQHKGMGHSEHKGRGDKS